jgi:leucine dehydrogenase
VHAMRAVCAALDGEADLRGRHVVIQGAGHVGSHLARQLVADGARVTVSDLFPSRAEAVARESGAEVVDVERAFTVPCDVFAPCALGAVFDTRTIPMLQCRAIVGAANNQLAEVGADRALADRGIVYAPDFVVNAGGIINIAEEFVGYDRDRAMARVSEIGVTTAKVLAAAAEHAITPHRAAERLALERIAREGSRRRWEPGDPAAWTNGQPLRALRPVPR